MESKPAVSVIVPVFNAEAFLAESLDSLIGQTLKDIEIICINDGSTDRSLEIIQSLAANDSRLIVIDKPNAGYGQTLNMGISVATGEYIGILEPDDFADHDMFEKLYAVAKENDADMVKSNYYMYSGMEKSDVFFETLSGKTYDTVLSARIDPRIVITQPCIWSGIYRKKMLADNHIRLNETPGASYQDTGFSFKVLSCSERVVFVKDAFLHYRIDNEASSVKSGGKVFAICDEFMSIQSFLNEDVERRARLSGMLQVIKFSSYEWNLSRISPEFKDEFRNQMALEFIKAEYDGFLKESDFDKARWKRLQDCIKSYKNPAEKEELNIIRNSKSYRLGKVITWLPRSIKRKNSKN